jgi:mono/diheme cytochrome c family protein
MQKLAFAAVAVILTLGISCSGKQQNNQTANLGVKNAQASVQEQPRPVDSTKAGHHEGMEHEGMMGDKGIGPIKEVKLGPIDAKLVKQGKTLFDANCTACHLLDEKKIGPPLRHVTHEHAPEFIMNMILNPVEMQKKNPEIMELVEEYGVLMSDLHLKKDQARAILEYLRSEGDKAKPTGK